MTRILLFVGIVALVLAGGIAMLGHVNSNRSGREQADGGNPPPANPHVPARPPTENRPPIHLPRLDATGLRQLDTDPGGALSAYADGEGAHWCHAADDLLVAWAARDPQAAMQWIDAGEHRVVRAQLLGAVATGILIRDGAEVMEAFLAKHQEDPQILPKYRGTLMQRVFYNLGREDTIDTALGILLDTRDSDLAGWMVLGIPGAQNQIAAIDYLEAKGIPVAVDYWSFQASIGEDPRYWADWAAQRESDMLPEIIQDWARDHPAEARTWIGQHFTPGTTRYAEVMELIK